MKLTNYEMQVVVDYLLVLHDSLFEMIMDKNSVFNDKECRKDELAIRKFLLLAKEKGLNIDRALYPMERKVKELDKED